MYGGVVRCSGEVGRKDAGIARNNRQDPRCGHSCLTWSECRYRRRGEECKGRVGGVVGVFVFKKLVWSCVSFLRGGGGECRHVKLRDRVQLRPAFDSLVLFCCLRGTFKPESRVRNPKQHAASNARTPPSDFHAATFNSIHPDCLAQDYYINHHPRLRAHQHAICASCTLFSSQ